MKLIGLTRKEYVYFVRSELDKSECILGHVVVEVTDAEIEAMGCSNVVYQNIDVACTQLSKKIDKDRIVKTVRLGSDVKTYKACGFSFVKLEDLPLEDKYQTSNLRRYSSIKFIGGVFIAVNAVNSSHEEVILVTDDSGR